MAAKSEHLESLNPAFDDAPAHIPSITIDVKSALGPRLDHLSEAQQGALPSTSPYPKYTTGLLLIPGTLVGIRHGRDDGECRVQLSNDALSRYEVNLCLKQLFTDARSARIHGVQIGVKLRDFRADGNGSRGVASFPRRRKNGARATPTFERNSIGHAWHAGWDAEAGALEIRVALDRAFLAGCGIVTLRDVVGLRQLSLSALLSPQDICQLPVPWNFSESREVLTVRLQRILSGLHF